MTWWFDSLGIIAEYFSLFFGRLLFFLVQLLRPILKELSTHIASRHATASATATGVYMFALPAVALQLCARLRVVRT